MEERDWEVSAEDREERVFSPAMGRFEDGDEGEKSREERHEGRREGGTEGGGVVAEEGGG